MPAESIIFVVSAVCVFGVAVAAIAYAQYTAASIRKD
jgi:hypothetical protein